MLPEDKVFVRKVGSGRAPFEIRNWVDRAEATLSFLADEIWDQRHVLNLFIHVGRLIESGRQSLGPPSKKGGITSKPWHQWQDRIATKYLENEFKILPLAATRPCTIHDHHLFLNIIPINPAIQRWVGYVCCRSFW